MLPPLGSEPRASDFTAPHATAWANFPIDWKYQPGRALLIPKKFKYKNQ